MTEGMPPPNPLERHWPVRFASDPYWTWMTFRPGYRYFDARVYERYAIIWLP